jgi:hypothetical protein
VLEFELSRLPSAAGAVLDWGIDAPPRGASGPPDIAYSIELQGWVVGNHLPVKALALSVDGMTLSMDLMRSQRPEVAARYPQVPGRHVRGFRWIVNALSLPVDFEVTLAAVMKDNSMESLAVLSGSRPTVRSDYRPKLQPLLVTMLGRSGSTVLTQLLSAHSAVVAYDPMLRETRVASYWADVLVTLADPRSYLAQISPPGGLQGWSLRLADQEAPPQLDDPVTHEWLDREGVNALATFCHSRIDAFYDRLDALGGSPDLRYFVEKCQPDLSNSPAGLLMELYPGLRELVLVRDFRDMVCSMMSYKISNGVGPFRPDSSLNDEEFIRSWGEAVAVLNSSWRRRSDTAHLVRYEDLMRQPRETVEAILRYLDLDAGDAEVDRLVSTLEKSAGEAGHRTTESTSASLGRWRTDLEPKLQRVAEDTFGEALAAFGYA